jgi:WD40 repeat protein
MAEKKKLLWENDYQVGSGASFTCAKFGQSGGSILAGASDQNDVLLWRVTNNKPKLTLQGQKSHSTVLQFSNDSKKLFSGTQGGTVHVWDLETSVDLVKLQGHLQPCTALATSTNESFLVTGSKDSKVKLWD